jgi:CheY-like chemotaxis protein
MILETAELIDRTVGEKIRIETIVSARPCTISVDRTQLQSAILNIAANARDAMPDGGRIELRLVDEPAAGEQRQIAVEVCDSGTGMSSETLAHIFEPFFTTKPAGKGTGLGLSQVYGFASQSGGDVRVTSTPGEGTCVSLVLPCSGKLAAEPGEPPAKPASDVPPSSILVVEDNQEVGAFAETLLSELGHRVTLAYSGEEALERARAERFDIVFTDVVMPGMGGLRLAETLAEEQPMLPVVLATGYSEEIAALGSGGRPFILKPYRLAALSDALAAALREKTG